MLVTVIRSKVGQVVELPDGWLLKPYKFVEVTEMPDSFKPKPGKDGEKPTGGLQKLVDAGLVDVAQIQDIGHLMVEGTSENKLPIETAGTDGAPMVPAGVQNKVDRENKEKPSYYTENSRVGLMSPKEKSASAEFRADEQDQYAPKVSISQLARGAGANLSPAELKSTVKLAQSLQGSEAPPAGTPVTVTTAAPAPAPASPAKT